MNFFEYLAGEKMTRDIISNIPNKITKKCKYVVDTLEVDHILVALDLEIANIKKDCYDLEKDLINLVKQKKSQTENMLNRINKSINKDDDLIEKFTEDQDNDNSKYIELLQKHKHDNELEYNYLALLLTKQIDWLRENS